MERLQKSMTAYVKTLSKRNEGDDKEKTLPVAYLGSTMVNHGEDFENDSEFGQCLIGTQGECNSETRLIGSQAWAGPMSVSHAFKRRTLQMQLQAGLSHLRDLSHK